MQAQAADNIAARCEDEGSTRLSRMVDCSLKPRGYVIGRIRHDAKRGRLDGRMGPRPGLRATGCRCTVARGCPCDAYPQAGSQSKADAQQMPAIE